MADRLTRPQPATPAVPRVQLGTDALTRNSGLVAAGAFAIAAIAIAAVQLPALHGYFFGDDFVPLADIETRSNVAYVRDLFLLRDLTPNWRFFTGLYYLVLYRAFGLDAFPFLLGSLIVHIGTAGLVFIFVRRVMKENWPALLASMLFGMSAAYVPTVGQVTAFNNVLAAFLIMLALVLLYEAFERDQPHWWWLASGAAFGGAIASNESAAVIAPLYAIVVLWRLPGDRRGGGWWLRVALYSLPFAVLGAAALVTFEACQCTEASNQQGLDHLWPNIWMYLGRLLYPVGMEHPGELGAAHLSAGIAVAALAALALAFGSGLARVSVVFLALALSPYVPIELWSATRYVYLASIPFAILAALYFWWLGAVLARHAPRFVVVVAVLAFAAIALNAWQTWEQEHEHVEAADSWRDLTTGLLALYPKLPYESTVYVRGAQFDSLYQCSVMPAVGELLWPGSKLFTTLYGDLRVVRIMPGTNTYAVDDFNGRFVPIDIAVATPEDLRNPVAFILPHVPPTAHGDICALSSTR